jgi:hypothetical protein
VNTLTEVIKLEAEDIKQNFNDIDFLKLLKQDMTPKKSEVRDKFQYTRLFKAIIKFIVALFEANDYLTNEITFDDMELEHALVQVLMDWRGEQEVDLFLTRSSSQFSSSSQYAVLTRILTQSIRCSR